MTSISKSVCLVFFETLILVLLIFPCPLYITDVNAASPTLAWDPNSEPDVAGYRIYFGNAMGNYASVIDVGNQTTYHFSDLEDGKTYYFVVTAYDILGRESDFSSELRYPEPFLTTMSLSAGLNLISLPLEPFTPSISSLTEQLSPCLLNILAYVNDTYAWEFYDPAQLDQSTLSTMDPAKGYWVEMMCPSEMTVEGNRTTNAITLLPGLNLVGYNGLTPLPISVGLSSIANKYSFVWGYEGDQWTHYDPADEAGSTLQVLSPGSGYWIEATEDAIWTLPWVMTMPLSAGLNLISLPLEPLTPSISSLTEQLSPCLLNILAYVNDTYAWEFYDPAQLDQSTLDAIELGKGYWVEMACPGEMMIIGYRATNQITLLPGLNLVGYNSLKPLPVSIALSSIADKYTMVWAYENDAWKYHNPADVAGSTLQILSPGSGYWIEATEETTWVLPQ